MAYPTTITTFTEKDCSTTTSFADAVNEIQDVIEALEAKVGVDNSGVTTSHEYKINLISTTSIVTKTANYTATLSDYTILCDATSGAITITLPAASTSSGKIYNIKKIDASGNNVVIDGNASETIDGATTQTITAQWTNRTIQSNGTAWFIL